MKTQKFQVTGMTCAACSAHVEKAAAGVEGVRSAAVNLLMNSMVIDYDKPATVQAVCAAVQAAGYGAVPVSADGGAQVTGGAAALEDRATPAIRRRLIASLCLLLPLMYVSMGHMMWGI